MNNKILTAMFALSVSTASLAYAQGSNFNQTLDNQMRLQSGAPVATTTTSTRVVNAVPPIPPAGIDVPYEPSAGVINQPGSNEGAIPALPLEIMSSGEIRFISGGISDELESQLKDVQNQFNVRVLMTDVNGGYIADATVKLLDSEGNQILHVMNAGPYFYAAVKMGTYTFEATEGSEVKRITIKVGGKPRGTQHIRFSSAS